MSSHTELKGFDNVGESLLSEQLESNVTSWFQWGLLCKGGFGNVTIPTSGAYGGNFHRLRLVDEPNYQLGQVWEGFRQDWVWETGVNYSAQPIRVSGVFVNGGFQPVTGVGSYAHKIDYRYGRVVFDTPLPESSVVTAEFSYRLFNFQPGSAPFWRQIQANSFRADQESFLQTSGAWSVLAQNRVQLPAVVVQPIPKTRRVPHEIGNLTHRVRQDVLFHIIAETPTDVTWLHDIITAQQEKRIVGYDKNGVLRDERFGLSFDGSPATSGLTYPQLVDQYPWRQLRVVEMASVQQPSGPLVTVEQPRGVATYLPMATVRGTFEVDLP